MFSNANCGLVLAVGPEIAIEYRSHSDVTSLSERVVHAWLLSQRNGQAVPSGHCAMVQTT